jgi:hypothetical protein
MQVLYKNNGVYIVKISENKFYYGNGKDINGFGVHPVQFLRFNPYMEYVECQKIPVPNKIREYIVAHKDT